MLAEGRHPAFAALLGLCHIALMSLFIVTGNWPTLRRAFVSHVELYSKEGGWKPLSGSAKANIGMKHVRRTSSEPVENHSSSSLYCID